MWLLLSNQSPLTSRARTSLSSAPLMPNAEQGEGFYGLAPWKAVHDCDPLSRRNWSPARVQRFLSVSLLGQGELYRHGISTRRACGSPPLSGEHLHRFHSVRFEAPALRWHAKNKAFAWVHLFAMAGLYLPSFDRHCRLGDALLCSAKKCSSPHPSLSMQR